VNGVEKACTSSEWCEASPVQYGTVRLLSYCTLSEGVRGKGKQR